MRLSIILFILATMAPGCAFAGQGNTQAVIIGNTAEIDVATLADAIYISEGGASTRHPYGVLAKYKHTTARAACINTINHAFSDWNTGLKFQEPDFIVFLGSRYAPVGVANDPTNLNKNWVSNVKYNYIRLIRKRVNS